MTEPLQRKRWSIAEPLDADRRALLGDHPPLLAQLMYNRGIRTRQQAEEFLAGNLHAGRPFAMKGMREAVARISRAIRRHEKLAVYGDFDTDGVTATALLVEALTVAGADVVPYIPDRVDEGYGLNLNALRKLYRQSVRLVITVDCGIRSLHEVEQTRHALDLIITDHHSPDETVPAAAAVINPNQAGCLYPFKKLAGVGVAYRLAQGIYHDCRHNHHVRVLSRLKGLDDEESLLDLVALGTVADVVPLSEENRDLVRRGLARLNRPDPTRRPGIAALMARAGVQPGQVDAEAIGFRLGPRLNAAGRIGSAMDAYHLLTEHDPDQARALAEKLDELNRLRQKQTDDMVVEAEKQVADGDPDVHLYLVGGEGFEPGIVGLAASRLVEQHYRPAIVVSIGEPESRGSCRSIPEFHITRALDQCRDLLVRHGGHQAAAGFTVRTKDLDRLRHRLQEIAADQLADVERRPVLDVDAEIRLQDVGWDMLDTLSRMEPCGEGNPRPVLASRGVVVQKKKATSGGKHLSLTLDHRDRAVVDAIYWQRGALVGRLPDRLDIAYTVGAKEWDGQRRLQLTVEDLRPAE